MNAQIKAVSAVFFLMLLAGCETVPMQDGQPSVEPASEDAQTNSPATSADKRSDPPQREPAVSGGDQINYLSGQLLTLQEQVIQIKADTAELRRNAQILLARLEMLNNQTVPSNGASNAASANVGPSLSPQNVEQLTAQLNNLLAQTQSSYELVSGYTAKGQWVLIRYDRFSGETWLADQNRWNLLEESTDILPSLYEVQVHRADKDIKGYVAARIDQKTGQTWWLRENTWQNFQ
ncbi:hypothetical protein Q4583_17310 [Neptunomonas phycophila]|uniref:Lipoprotein n=1 Tax=Neptunomonas phycophila TaxID=1572645 RepID=A0AAW7XQT4_9GAMM|nr:hypothetical protein [Neptunomonas phycophila]MDO6455379.1 hypothetical protein [Neptunomonas phycophila]MDO6785876.1 hypothetical protein [Neptunomonas phycophila]